MRKRFPVWNGSNVRRMVLLNLPQQFQTPRFCKAGIGYGCDILPLSTCNWLREMATCSGKKHDMGEDNNDYVCYSLLPGRWFYFSAFENQSGSASYNLIVKTNSDGDNFFGPRIFRKLYQPGQRWIVNTDDGVILFHRICLHHQPVGCAGDSLRCNGQYYME